MVGSTWEGRHRLEGLQDVTMKYDANDVHENGIMDNLYAWYNVERL